MPVSVSSLVGPEVPGNRKMVFADGTFDSSYATGGEEVSLTALGLTRLDYLLVDAGQGYLARWDGSLTSPKILLYRQTAATGALVEVPSTTNVATIVVRILAFGA